MKAIKFFIGENLIEIWEEDKVMRTTFPDGVTLIAAPEDNDAYRKTAEELGYEDTWMMCKSHEILHTSIAVGEGHPYSRGLWRAAKGIEADALDRIEERRVLNIQKLNK